MILSGAPTIYQPVVQGQPQTVYLGGKQPSRERRYKHHHQLMADYHVFYWHVQYFLKNNL